MKRNDTSAGNGNAGTLNAFLDQGSAFEGKLTFKGAVRIDGRFTGEVLSSDALFVGETGEIDGTIRVGEAVVSGVIRGSLIVERRLKLLATARVEGEIQTAALVVDEGAKFDGRVSMQSTPAKAEQARLETVVRDALDGGKPA